MEAIKITVILFVSLQCLLISGKPFSASKVNKHQLSDPALPCNATQCQLPNCHCASTSTPGGLSGKETPQIVTISIDDGLRDLDYTTYYSPVFNGRKNPNGCPIGLTYFTSHYYSDYSLMEHAYHVDAAEFADHSVTHREPTTWWENASEEEWTHEIMDQRSIIGLWGGVPEEEVRGWRSPFLVTSETQLKVLHENKFLYEASMGTSTNYWPFTLDYKSPICNSPATCPVNSYPGLWIVPTVLYKQSSGYPCAMLDACTAPVSEEDWMSFFEENFEVHYSDNRSPFGIYSHSSWFFQGQARVNALTKFLDKLAGMKDVYIVTHKQMLDWVRSPTPLEKIGEFESWKCPPRPAPRCDYTTPPCLMTYPNASNAILKTCSAPCPVNYPGYGNPEGK